MNEQIRKIKEIIDQSNNIVLFTGAGISVPSGIPDFRSANGIYNQKLDYTFKPEEIISHSFFVAHPDYFYEFYKSKMIYPNALPNEAHYYFASLEARGKLKAVITQNIDGLHTLAGSKCVYEIHGSVLRNYCTKCHKFYSDKDILAKPLIPYCDCGGLIKPDVVLYEEALPEDVFSAAYYAVSKCDVLIIVGTSLVVQPAASLVQLARGKVILINKSATPYDHYADVAVNDDIVNVVKELESYE